jgi:hypothetical protein
MRPSGGISMRLDVELGGAVVCWGWVLTWPDQVSDSGGSL